MATESERDDVSGAGTYQDRTIYKRLLQQSRPYWFHILFYCVLEFLTGFFTLLLPLPLKLAVDNVVGSEPLPRWVDRILPDAVTSSSGRLLIFVVALLVLLRLSDLLHSIATSLV